MVKIPNRMNGNHQRKRSLWMKEVRLRHSPDTDASICECAERNRASEGETIRSANFWTQNINLYSIRHCVTHCIVYPFCAPFIILLHVQKMPISNLCSIEFTVVQPHSMNIIKRKRNENLSAAKISQKHNVPAIN